MKLTIELIGTRPMLQHNGRLANPLDQYAQALKAINGKRGKTDEDLQQVMMIEARGACWETTEGLLGVPNAAVWRCLFDAAKGFKRGQDIKRALILDDTVEPLLVSGKQVKCDDFLADLAHIDYRPVKIGMSKVMRARPRVDDWSSTHHFELLTDVIEPRDLAPIFERAGRLCGLGDWRPTYGTFSVDVL